MLQRVEHKTLCIPVECPTYRGRGGIVPVFQPTFFSKSQSPVASQTVIFKGVVLKSQTQSVTFHQSCTKNRRILVPILPLHEPSINKAYVSLVTT